MNYPDQDGLPTKNSLGRKKDYRTRKNFPTGYGYSMDNSRKRLVQLIPPDFPVLNILKALFGFFIQRQEEGSPTVQEEEEEDVQTAVDASDPTIIPNPVELVKSLPDGKKKTAKLLTGALLHGMYSKDVLATKTLTSLPAAVVAGITSNMFFLSFFFLLNLQFTLFFSDVVLDHFGLGNVPKNNPVMQKQQDDMIKDIRRSITYNCTNSK